MHQNVDEATTLLKSLASRNRLLILCQLVEAERSVGELAQRLDLSSTVVSQHLGLLRRDRLVKARRDGQNIYYSLRGEAARRLLDTLHDIYCAEDST